MDMDVLIVVTTWFFKIHQPNALNFHLF